MRSTPCTTPFHILAQGVAPEGFQFADERESLLWGLVNMLDSQTQRLDRAADKLMPDLRDLQTSQDGTEIRSRELELVTDRAQNLTARRDAFEQMRDAAADAYRSETGSMWRPRRGSHASQTGKLTSAAIDDRDYQRARKDRKTLAHLPQGTLVAIAGGKDITNRLMLLPPQRPGRRRPEPVPAARKAGPARSAARDGNPAARAPATASASSWAGTRIVPETPPEWRPIATIINLYRP